LVQICAKVGGTPWGVSDLPFTDAPTMICGMDVYHSTARGRKSMLSFVSSEDEFFSRYMTQTLEMEMGVEFSFNLC
jgi:aubergine-like protein